MSFVLFDQAGIDDRGKMAKMVYTQAENAMLLSIEDVNEKFSREEKKAANKKGVEIGFMDVNQMGGLASTVYIITILGGLLGVLYFFYDKMVLGPDSEE